MTVLKKIKSHPDEVDYFKGVLFKTRRLKNQGLNA